MASMIVSALKRDDHHNGGDIISFFSAFLEIHKLEQWMGVYGHRRGRKDKVRNINIHSETIDDESESLIWEEATKKE